MVAIEQNILGENDRYAAANRAAFAARRQFVLNLVSSPGSGKTTLLTSTLQALNGELPLADGHEERLPAYQLYHLLNHLNLFGGGYYMQSEQILLRYAQR